MRLKHLILLWFISFHFLELRTQVLDAQVYNLFNDNKEYIQLNMYFLANAFTQLQVKDSLFQAKVEVSIIVRKNSQIVKVDRLLIKSPEQKTLQNFAYSTIYGLDTGDYEMTLIAKDGDNENEEIFRGMTSFSLQPISLLSVSDILPISYVSSTKSPDAQQSLQNVYVSYIPFNYVGKNQDVLHFYYEIRVPLDGKETILIAESLEKLGNGQWIDMGTKYQRLSMQRSHPVKANLSSRKLTDVPSGEYRIKVALMDEKRNELSSSEYLFVKSNPEADENQILKSQHATYLDQISIEDLELLGKATAIVVPASDVPILNAMLENKKYDGLKSYLYKYWGEIDPVHPQETVLAFIKKAKDIDITYQSGFRRGFESDRGRIALIYGQPNDIVGREQDMTGVPYEIWIYNKIEKSGQTNVKFIFYNPSLVSGDMELLHSNAIGEIKNYKWERMIYSDVKGEFDGPNHIDANGMQDNINRNARRLYDDN